MAKRQFHLSKEEIEAIRQREHETDDPQELKRLQAVRTYGSQVPIHQITAVVGCSQDRVRHWSHRYKQDGLDGMRSQCSTQNAAKLTVDQKLQIKQRLRPMRCCQRKYGLARANSGRSVICRWR